VGAIRFRLAASGRRRPPRPTSKPTIKRGRARGRRIPDSSYVIGADDVLAISVWKEPMCRVPVPGAVRREDLVASGGRTDGGWPNAPATGNRRSPSRLASYISEPEVTVIGAGQQEPADQHILGMVVRPGTYLLTDRQRFWMRSAMAGGFKDFAKQKAIYVLRARTPTGTQKRISFNYKEVIKGNNPDQNVSAAAARYGGGSVVVFMRTRFHWMVAGMMAALPVLLAGQDQSAQNQPCAEPARAEHPSPELR